MLHWKTARHGAAKDFVDIACGSPDDIGQINSIGDQTTAFSKIAEWIDGGHHMSYREPGDQVAVVGHEDIGHHDESAVRPTGKCHNRIFDLSHITHRRMSV